MRINFTIRVYKNSSVTNEIGFYFYYVCNFKEINKSIFKIAIFLFLSVHNIRNVNFYC